MSQLPTAFTSSLTQFDPYEKQAFVEALNKEAAVSIRLNANKIPSNLKLNPILWSKHGYYLEERPFFTFDPLLHAGAYYVQEASSMFLEQAIRQSIDTDQALRVLDLCAAPGGKSTLLQQLLSKDSLLVSNEVIRSRAHILVENMQKWGSHNVIISQNDPKDFESLPHFFDVIVIDAPCSGEGMFRKDHRARNEWSPEHVALCALRQERIVESAWQSLKEGGLLVYSTCTFNRKENESINDKILAMGGESIRLQLNDQWEIEESVEGTNYGYRFYPHRLRGEGLFICAIRKKGKGSVQNPKLGKTGIQALNKRKEADFIHYLNDEIPWNIFAINELHYAFPKVHFSALQLLQQRLKLLYAGTAIGSEKKGQLIPHAALALSMQLRKECFPQIAVDLNEALNFLRKSTVACPQGAKGWQLITHENVPLGFIKAVGKRSNNYWPKEWRILQDPASNTERSTFNLMKWI